MTTTKQIPDQFWEIIDQLIESDNGQLGYKEIMSKSSEFAELAATCRETPIFQDSTDRYNALKAEIKSTGEKEGWVIRAWCHIMERIASAPIGILAVSSIILCTPLLSELMLEEE